MRCKKREWEWESERASAGKERNKFQNQKEKKRRRTRIRKRREGKKPPKENNTQPSNVNTLNKKSKWNAKAAKENVILN